MAASGILKATGGVLAAGATVFGGQVCSATVVTLDTCMTLQNLRL